MCLAVPAQVIEIMAGQDLARVSLGGLQKEISLALLEGVEVGDYVLVHVGYALSRIDVHQARETLALMEQAGVKGDRNP